MKRGRLDGEAGRLDGEALHGEAQQREAFDGEAEYREALGEAGRKLNGEADGLDGEAFDGEAGRLDEEACDQARVGGEAQHSKRSGRKR